MTKGQFVLLAAALSLVTMGGAGYIAYASTTSSSTGSSTGGTGTAAGGQGSGAGGGTVTLPSDGESASASTSATPQCVNGDVQVTESEGQGAAGHISLVLIFQNVSGHSCSLYGYPGASLVGSGGTDLLDAKRDRGGLTKIPDVVLAAGGQASTVLEWSDVPTSSAPGGCAVQNAAHLVVTPPNFTQSTTLSIGAGTEVCSEFEIHPVVTGVSGTLTGN